VIRENHEEQRAPSERFHSYMRGYKNGSFANAKDERYAGHHRLDLVSEYERGYRHGRADAMKRSNAAAKRLRYDMAGAILREARTPSAGKGAA